MDVGTQGLDLPFTVTPGYNQGAGSRNGAAGTQTSAHTEYLWWQLDGWPVMPSCCPCSLIFKICFESAFNTSCFWRSKFFGNWVFLHQEFSLPIRPVGNTLNSIILLDWFPWGSFLWFKGKNNRVQWNESATLDGGRRGTAALSKNSLGPTFSLNYQFSNL